jgi:hypothetical protein
MVYYCRDCNAWVGVHKGTDKPLGVLANSELREWKKRAHTFFDKLWKTKKMRRGAAYLWLAMQMEKTPDETHIGMFSVEECRKVINICIEFETEALRSKPVYI